MLLTPLLCGQLLKTTAGIVLVNATDGRGHPRTLPQSGPPCALEGSKHTPVAVQFAGFAFGCGGDLDSTASDQRIDLGIQGLPPGTDPDITNHVPAHIAAFLVPGSRLTEDRSNTLFPPVRPALIPAMGSDQKYRPQTAFFGTYL